MKSSVTVDQLVIGFEQNRDGCAGRMKAKRLCNPDKTIYFNRLETVDLEIGHAGHPYTLGIAYDIIEEVHDPGHVSNVD